MKYVSATDIGLLREENQDMVKVKEFYGNVLAAVCDGMGGERSGQDASRIAIEEFFSRFDEGYSPELDTIGVRQLMTSSVSAANSIVYTTARMDYKSFGMGTTCVAAYIDDKYIYIINIGDSRAYYMDENGLHQITSDHTLVNLLLMQGKIEPDEVQTHPKRNMLTKAVGVEKTVKPDFYRMKREEKFTILLCSDGLSGYCSDSEIYEIMKSTPLEDLSRALIDLAFSKGGRDNITLAVITD
ncbi:Stp1/IreP family PP2C-type Ser/Thr phosphatase [Porcipelethomonas sp.]|uniref:Stp1/IreP family PP2C-type Ser/Thr phosphatase n=1 Tax=Porcipelethomonas sp. TaxID=2981675 RepID=UPI003EF82665